MQNRTSVRVPSCRHMPGGYVGVNTSDMCHILGSESSNANRTRAKTAAQSSMAFMHTCSVMYKPLDRVAEQALQVSCTICCSHSSLALRRRYCAAQ